jgi:cytochrome P450
VAVQLDGDRLDRDELVATVQLVLVAGQETTADLVANGILALLTHPEQWQLLKDDPSLAGAAVEEIARFDGPVELAPPRYAFRVFPLGGGIHFCLGAPLARLQGRIVFEKIAEQLPELRLLADPRSLRGVSQRLACLPLAA